MYRRIRRSIAMIGVPIHLALALAATAANAQPVLDVPPQDNVAIGVPNNGDDDAEAPASENRGLLSLGLNRVNSPVAQAWLGTRAIEVRNPDSEWMPSGRVSIPVLGKPSENELMERVRWVQRNFGEGVLKRDGNVWTLTRGLGNGRTPGDTARSRFNEHLDFMRELWGRDDPRVREDVEARSPLEGYRFWLHANSGAFKLTVLDRSVPQPSRLADADEALQIALNFVAENELVVLSEDESMDIVSVAMVRNAATTYPTTRTVEPFVSDHYVKLGRRYDGVPVVGSNVLVRVNAVGEVAAVAATWRPIESELAPVPITETPLSERIRGSLAQTGEDPHDIARKPIQVEHRRCGYLEAPLSREQRSLRPGCDVSYRLGDVHDEIAPQMRVALTAGSDPTFQW